MTTKTLNAVINLRGLREQSFKLAFGWKGGMKQCYTRGCEIFSPMELILKGTEISEALNHQRLFYGELK